MPFHFLWETAASHCDPELLLGLPQTEPYFSGIVLRMWHFTNLHNNAIVHVIALFLHMRKMKFIEWCVQGLRDGKGQKLVSNSFPQSSNIFLFFFSFLSSYIQTMAYILFIPESTSTCIQSP